MELRSPCYYYNHNLHDVSRDDVRDVCHDDDILDDYDGGSCSVDGGVAELALCSHYLLVLH